jgi:hypothetical protein
MCHRPYNLKNDACTPESTRLPDRHLPYLYGTITCRTSRAKESTHAELNSSGASAQFGVECVQCVQRELGSAVDFLLDAMKFKTWNRHSAASFRRRFVSSQSQQHHRTERISQPDAFTG